MCANYVKFNIVNELNKTLAGKPSKVPPIVLLHLIADEYLQEDKEDD